MGLINLFHRFVLFCFFPFKNLYRGERWTVLRGRRELALAITKRTMWKTRTGTRRPQRQTQKTRRPNDQSTRVGNKSACVIHLLYLNLSKWHIFNESFTSVTLNYMVMVWAATWCLIWTLRSTTVSGWQVAHRVWVLSSLDVQEECTVVVQTVLVTYCCTKKKKQLKRWVNITLVRFHIKAEEIFTHIF